MNRLVRVVDKDLYYYAYVWKHRTSLLGYAMFQFIFYRLFRRAPRSRTEAQPFRVDGDSGQYIMVPRTTTNIGMDIGPTHINSVSVICQFRPSVLPCKQRTAEPLGFVECIKYIVY